MLVQECKRMQAFNVDIMARKRIMECPTHRNHCQCQRVRAGGRECPAGRGMHWGTSGSADYRCRRGCHRAGHRPGPRAPYHCCSSPHRHSVRDRVSSREKKMENLKGFSPPVRQRNPPDWPAVHCYFPEPVPAMILLAPYCAPDPWTCPCRCGSGSEDAVRPRESRDRSAVAPDWCRAGLGTGRRSWCASGAAVSGGSSGCPPSRPVPSGCCWPARD